MERKKEKVVQICFRVDTKEEILAVPVLVLIDTLRPFKSLGVQQSDHHLYLEFILMNELKFTVLVKLSGIFFLALTNFDSYVYSVSACDVTWIYLLILLPSILYVSPISVSR